MPQSYAVALQRFLEKSSERKILEQADRVQPVNNLTHSCKLWNELTFFLNGTAGKLAENLDKLQAKGRVILPPAENMFRALELTPLHQVKIVIIGQDPYPTPGDAHGLAFSYVGKRRLPASLKAILKEVARDLSMPVTQKGDLTFWAQQGVLLLNSALSVEAGKAGSHLKFGWNPLIEEIIRNISNRDNPTVFMLWGNSARKYVANIDKERHLVLETGHPSPLNRLRDFEGCAHFSKANAWLRTKGREPVDWFSTAQETQEI